MAIDQHRILNVFAEDWLAMRRSDRTERTRELATAFGAMRCAYCALRVAGYHGASGKKKPLYELSQREEQIKTKQIFTGVTGNEKALRFFQDEGEKESLYQVFEATNYHAPGKRLR
jgi:hypothetical protein